MTITGRVAKEEGAVRAETPERYPFENFLGILLARTTAGQEPFDRYAGV